VQLLQLNEAAHQRSCLPVASNEFDNDKRLEPGRLIIFSISTLAGLWPASWPPPTGLQHTVATILAEMGYNGRDIADLLGQKTTVMGEHYSGRANRTRKIAAIVTRFEEEVKRRQDRA
jgi:integrase